MVHLNRPVEAMRVIYKALKPGGVMVCEEADVSAVYAEPRSSAYEEMRDIGLKAGQTKVPITPAAAVLTYGLKKQAFMSYT
jgi:hypothetical protein